MNAADVTSLIASVVSVILGGFAIWLSVVFYKMSVVNSKATEEAAKGIAASVHRLENLFEKLYSDTFSLMRDTYSDMRKHAWPQPADDGEQIEAEAEKKADEKIAAVKAEVSKEIAAILDRQKTTDSRIGTLSRDVQQVLNRAISETRKVEVEARENSLRNHLLRTLLKMTERFGRSRVRAEELVGDTPTIEAIREVERMKAEGLVDFADLLAPATLISITHRGVRVATEDASQRDGVTGLAVRAEKVKGEKGDVSRLRSEAIS